MGDMSIERALAITREIGVSLGGEQGEAILMVVGEATRVPSLVSRLVEQRSRKSSTRLLAVGAAALGAQHFAKATADLQEIATRVGTVSEELTAGLAEVQRGSRALREEETGPAPTEPPEDR